MGINALLKALGMLGTMLGIYNALISGVPLEKFVIITSASLLLISVAKIRTNKQKKKEEWEEVRISVPTCELERGLIIRENGTATIQKGIG